VVRDFGGYRQVIGASSVGYYGCRGGRRARICECAGLIL